MLSKRTLYAIAVLNVLHKAAKVKDSVMSHIQARIMKALMFNGVMAFYLAFPVALTCTIAFGADLAPTIISTSEISPANDTAHGIDIYLGQSRTIQFANEIAALHTSDKSVCQIERLGDDSGPGVNVAILTATGIGTTRVTLFAKTTSEPVTYKINVLRDPEGFAHLQATINTEFKCTNVEIVTAPHSEKVIIRGNVSDARSAEQIIQFITSKNLSANDIINRLTIPACPCVHYPSVQPPRKCKFRN